MRAPPESRLPSLPDLPRFARRRAWVDAARGLGIALVVVGHVLRGLSAAALLPDTAAWAFVDRFIYAFHMPLFFFVAGLFLMPSADERLSDFAHRRLVRLGYPYLVWATLQTLFQVLLARYTNHPAGLADFLKLAFHPPMQFWFLYALLLQALFISVLAKLGLGRAGILLVSALLFASMDMLPSDHWFPLNQARAFLIYTALGVFMGAPERLDALEGEGRSGKVHLTLSLLGFAVVGWSVWSGASAEAGSLRALAVAALGTLASVCACVFLAGLEAAPGKRVTRLLMRWGEASLAIYVAHTLASAATRIALVKLLHVEDVTAHVVLGTSFGLCAPWALFAVTRQRGIPYLFEWPSAHRRTALPLPESTSPGSPAR